MTDEIIKPNYDFVNMLRESAKNNNSIACMGLDPTFESIPIDGTFRTKVTQFYEKIFDRMLIEGVLPGAFKPNHGFYEKHDNKKTYYHEGSETLNDVIFMLNSKFPGTPIILDFKRADIANSSTNYAEVGIKSGANAVTVPPYMGTDSVMPFIETGMGVYILDRTSNEGGKDFQNKMTIRDKEAFKKGLNALLFNGKDNLNLVDMARTQSNVTIGRFIDNYIWKFIEQEAPPLYQIVAEKIAGDWSKDYKGVGAVFGATNIEELKAIAPFFAKNNTPLLIPGVGKQGGSAQEVIEALYKSGYNLSLARINSSREITHPWKIAVNAPKEWDVAVVQNLKKLNGDINYRNAA